MVNLNKVSSSTVIGTRFLRGTTEKGNESVNVYDYSMWCVSKQALEEVCVSALRVLVRPVNVNVGYGEDVSHKICESERSEYSLEPAEKLRSWLRP